MPTSRTSRKKIIWRKFCWLRRTSFNSTSALMEIFSAASCDCHAFLKSSKLIAGSFQFFRKLLADAVQFHADIIFRNAQHVGHFLIAQAVEVHSASEASTFGSSRMAA